MPRAIIYGRVSSVAQADRGLSIPSQFAELRDWCGANGYGVVGEVADTGGKGSKRDDLDRPGLDEVYDLAERLRLVEGDVVIAQAWDRLGEDDVPSWIGRRLAMVSGARLRTPDDPNTEGDDGADLLRLVGRWNAGRERRQTARRSRSRKLELARRGFIVPSHTPTYGFAFAGEHNRAYEVYGKRAAVVRRIFKAIAAGSGVRAIVRELDASGVPTPPTPNKKKNPDVGRTWNRRFVRNVVLNDCFKAHTDAELDALVGAGHMRPDVRAHADAGCGIWWYGAKDYEGNPHRVAVPVPGIGVPRETVEEARRRLANNRPASLVAGHHWTLSRGVMVCGGCGRGMVAHNLRRKGSERINRYYRCGSPSDTREGLCSDPARVSALKAEAAVWEFVAALETQPERIVAALDAAIAKERARLRVDPAKELREVGRLMDGLAGRRANFQDQQAADLMTLDELRARLEGLEEERVGLERRAASLRTGGERLAELEELRGYYARSLEDPIMALAVDDGITVRRMKMLKETDGPDQRRRYEALRLKVVVVAKDELEVRGVFGADTVYIDRPSRRPNPQDANTPAEPKPHQPHPPRTPSTTTDQRRQRKPTIQSPYPRPISITSPNRIPYRPIPKS